MDKSFCESQGKPAFDWNLFLANPPEINSREHNNAIDLASAWVTCAVGNSCAIIPRNEGDGPLDEELRILGFTFADNIGDGVWPAARATLAAIEVRSAFLIREELAKLNP